MILIADSSAQIIDRLERLVSEADSKLQIYKAVTYEDALKLFVTYKPQVVLLDMHFPENKSFDLLKEMKVTGGKTYIIVLSNHGRVNVKEHCKRLGVDCCLDKYNEFDRIPAIIRDVAKITTGAK